MNRPPAAVSLIVGVTGHRDLVVAETPQLEAAVEAFFSELMTSFPGLPLQVITPLADGADRLVARVASRLGLQISVLLPMPRELYEMDFDEESLEVFREMLSYGEIIELPLLPGNEEQRVAHYGPQRDSQYEYLGVYIAAHSHILLAIWDGKPSAAPGGTAHVIRHHQEGTMALLEKDPRRSRIDLSEDESDLVHHIVCSREATGGPRSGLGVGSRCWLSRDVLLPSTQNMPARYTGVFQRQAELNVDLRRLKQASETQLADFAAAPNAAHLGDIHQLFLQVDGLALRFQKRALTLLRWMYSFALLAGLAFISYLVFAHLNSVSVGYTEPWLVSVFYLSLVSLGGVLYLTETAAGWFRKYIDYRGLAEGLRVQFFWALSGVPADSVSWFSHDAFMKRQDLEVGWIRNVMRHAGLRANATKSKATPVGVSVAARVWVQHSVSSETAYYARRARERTLSVRQATGFIVAGFFGSFLIALVLVIGGEFSIVFQTAMIALMGALPFAAGVRMSYGRRVVERESITQYRYMERIFENARQLLSRAESDAARQEVLRALGEAALDENGMWMLRLRDRSLRRGAAR